MNLIKSPNRWSCVPTAFAMAMGVDLDTIIRDVGHDGSEIIFPDLPEPQCRRSFHIQELIRVAWDYGYSVTEFQATCIMSPDGLQLHMFEMRVPEAGYGVLTGMGKRHRHAVAVDYRDHSIYDPAGKVLTLSDIPIMVDTYYRLTLR